MRRASLFSHQLESLILDRKVVTMPEMVQALDGAARMTVFRKLRPLAYRSSYSHGGKYYTLDEVAEFNDDGIWSWKGVRFSRFGTLTQTLQALVCGSQAGYFAEEMRGLVHVRTKDTLLSLWRLGRLRRESMWDRFLYLSPQGYEKQLVQRRLLEAERREPPPEARDSILAEERVREEFLKFLGALNEKQRRWFVGLESLKIGRGGDRRMAELTGMDVKTIARGREELGQRDITPERIRKAGAGRPALKKNRGHSPPE